MYKIFISVSFEIYWEPWFYTNTSYSNLTPWFISFFNPLITYSSLLQEWEIWLLLSLIHVFCSLIKPPVGHESLIATQPPNTLPILQWLHFDFENLHWLFPLPSLPHRGGFVHLTRTSNSHTRPYFPHMTCLLHASRSLRGHLSHSARVSIPCSGLL